jgi:hypothetical protein
MSGANTCLTSPMIPPAHELPDCQVGNGAGDNQQLDLLARFEDVVIAAFAAARNRLIRYSVPACWGLHAEASGQPDEQSEHASDRTDSRDHDDHKIVL